MSTSQGVEVNDSRLYRINKMCHLDVISKSIGRIVNHSKNSNFQADIGKMLNVKVGRRKKTTQTETMKLLKVNYQVTTQSQIKKDQQNKDQPSLPASK